MSTVIMQDLIVYVTSNERVCPQPMKWDKMWQVMGSPSRNIPDFPGLPLILNGWHMSTDKEKRLRLIEQIKFGNQMGTLDKVDKFLRALSEDDWHHCPEERLNAPSGGELMVEEWKERENSIRQVRSQCRELLEGSNFSGCDGETLYELLVTFRIFYFGCENIEEQVLVLEDKIDSYKNVIKNLDNDSEFALSYCSDLHKKNEEELLLCKILLCIGEWDIEAIFPDDLDD